MQVLIGAASNYRVAGIGSGIGDLREDKTSILEISGVLERAEGHDFAGGEGVEEKACPEHLSMDLLELGHAGAFFYGNNTWVWLIWVINAACDHSKRGGGGVSWEEGIF